MQELLPTCRLCSHVIGIRSKWPRDHLLFIGAGPRIDHVDLPAMNSCTAINCPQLKPEHTMAFKWTKASRAKLSRSQKARWKERKRQLRRKRPKRPSR